MNTYKKGQLNERWLEEYMLKTGEWLCCYKAPHVRWSKNHDIYSVFDGVSIDKDQNVVLWQLKSNKSHYSTFKKVLMAWTLNNCPENDRVKPILYLKFSPTLLRSYEIVRQTVGKEGDCVKTVLSSVERFVPIKKTTKG